MNLVLSLFLGKLGPQGITENFCKFAKVSYLAFEGVFMDKTSTKLDFAHTVLMSALKSYFKMYKLFGVKIG